ncbi:MAG: NAD-dependent epimerase/dehydratase family protein [Pseudomonadota bacterium]
MIRVAITGAKGLIGRALIAFLVQEDKVAVTALTRNLSPDEPIKTGYPDGIQWIQGDLNSLSDCDALVEGQNVIIHLAHTNSPLTSDRDMAGDTRLNLIPTLNLLRAIEKAGQKPHFIYPSSGGAIYGNCIERIPFAEDHTCRPINSYGIQKLAAEHYIRHSAERSHLTATVLRIANVYGCLLSPVKWQGFIGTALFQTLKDRPVRILGNPENVRDYIHIDDVCRAFIQCLEKRNRFDIFNIGTGIGTSVEGVLNHIERILDRPLKRIQEDYEGAAHLPPWGVLDVTKARRDLGWSAQISLPEGILKMLRTHGFSMPA